jgi:hypothetical protein
MFSSESMVLAFIFCLGSFKVANETSTACVQLRPIFSRNLYTPKMSKIIVSSARSPGALSMSVPKLPCGRPSRLESQYRGHSRRKFRANKERKSEISGSKNHSYTGFSIPVSIGFFAPETCQAFVTAWEHPACAGPRPVISALRLTGAPNSSATWLSLDIA